MQLTNKKYNNTCKLSEAKNTRQLIWSIHSLPDEVDEVFILCQEIL